MVVSMVVVSATQATSLPTSATRATRALLAATVTLVMGDGRAAPGSRARTASWMVFSFLNFILFVLLSFLLFLPLLCLFLDVFVVRIVAENPIIVGGKFSVGLSRKSYD